VDHPARGLVVASLAGTVLLDIPVAAGLCDCDAPNLKGSLSVSVRELDVTSSTLTIGLRVVSLTVLCLGCGDSETVTMGSDSP
jgi:hypothetical protein